MHRPGCLVAAGPLFGESCCWNFSVSCMEIVVASNDGARFSCRPHLCLSKSNMVTNVCDQVMMSVIFVPPMH